MDKNKNNNSLENIAWSVMEKKPPKLKRYIVGADQNKDRGLRDHTAAARVKNSDVRRKKGGLALFTEKPQEACDVMQSCTQIQTLVKIRVETQAMCLAQFVLSCMNTLLDRSSSVSTSVL